MNIKELRRLMQSAGEWNGTSHRFYSMDDPHYERMEEIAKGMQRLPKDKRIRWWTRGTTVDGRKFVEVAMQ